MDVYLAGLVQHPYAYEGLEKEGFKVKYPQITTLASYYYLRNDRLKAKAKEFGKLLIDSGCFTFMFDKKLASKTDLDAYTDEYIRFVNDYDIDLFVEMDVDSVCGLKEAERLRAKLERGTGKQPIPVWHVSRGKDYFIGMCKDYPYVAFGGLMSDGVSKKKLEAAFPWFIDKAHENGAKIHGLGYSTIEGLKKYHFDSVDSTNWTYGNISGYVEIFDPKEVKFKKVKTPEGFRCNPKKVSQHNLREWLKFQEYARKYL